MKMNYEQQCASDEYSFTPMHIKSVKTQTLKLLSYSCFVYRTVTTTTTTHVKFLYIKKLHQYISWTYKNKELKYPTEIINIVKCTKFKF